MLLHFSGSNGSTTFKDDSYTPSASATFSGASVISTTQSKFGGSSVYFNGNNASKFKCANTNTKVNFGDNGGGDFTIELWFYYTTLIAWTPLIHFNTSAWYQGPAILMNNSGQLYLENSYGGGNAWTLNTNQVPTTGVWHHIAVVGTSGQHVKIYLNGTLSATRAGSYTFSLPTGGDIYLGHAFGLPGGLPGDTGVRTMNGYIDEVRISNVARYSGNFTPQTSEFPNATISSANLPSDPSVGTIVHLDGGVCVCSSTSPVTWKQYDKTPKTFSVTNATETINTSNSPARYTQIDASDFLAWRLSEDPGATTFVSSINPGASTNLTIGSTSKFRSGIDEGLFQRTVTFQGGADSAERYLRGAAAVTPSSSTSFSASVWIIPYSNAIISGADPYIFGKYWHANSSWSGPYLGVYTGLNGAGGWGGGLYINGTGLVTFSAKTPLALNYPHLIAVTYDGNYIRLYQNGFLAGISSNYNGAAASYGSGPWYVGKAPVGFPGHSFDGQIWDIRVANTVRTEAYYRNMYLNGTARWG